MLKMKKFCFQNLIILSLIWTWTFAAAAATTTLDQQLIQVLKHFQGLYPEDWYETPQEPIADENTIKWLKDFNDELALYSTKEANLLWKFSTNMTHENEFKLNEFAPVKSKWMKKKKIEALKLSRVGLDLDSIRMLYIIRNLSFSYQDEDMSRKVAKVENEMSRIYSTTQVKMIDGKMLNGEPDLADIMRNSRDYDELLFAWKSWRQAVGPKLRPLYTQMVSLANKGAKSQGYIDMGEVWRMPYEVKDLEMIAEKIWNQLRPFYMQFHAYVRHKLSKHYGKEKVDLNKAIPAHLLGNMWGQEWNGIMDIVKPYDIKSIDITSMLKSHNYDVNKIFKTAEDFYTSIGLFKMTDKFWDLSMLKEPGRSTKVDCHGSAQDFMSSKDFRIKMCTSISSDSFVTAHHEMGHVEYFMSYKDQAPIFRDGANPGFHEAIGDTITYSLLTPKHLRKIGLIDSSATTNYEYDINFLMNQALRNFALVPWTLLVDLWRYNVFRGKINESNYNSEWWRYRLKYQGIGPPVERNETHFDPGAKYHIPNNVPYIRYFFARILQLQFHSTLCDIANNGRRDVPLHRCDIYGSKEAGKYLKKMMSLGSSRPWWDALQVLTGSPHLDPMPILRFYKPLHDWLVKVNKDNGIQIGW